MGDVPDVDVEFLPSHRSNFSQPDAKKVGFSTETLCHAIAEVGS
jgi:hypothetical protein